MKAITVSPANTVQDIELAQPVAQGRDLLVKIEAVALNPVDLLVRDGHMPGGGGDERVLGWDAAGTVVAVGPDATLFKVGDPVYYAGSLVRNGAYAEYQLVDERIAGRKPASLDFEHAAALPLTAITAWEVLFERLGISRTGAHKGKRVLIIGGAGGVGSIAIQLAKLAGLTVIATASRPASIQWVRERGADHVIDHSGDMAAQLLALGFQDVDYVLSLNDTDLHFDAIAQIIAPQGKVCSIVPSKAPLAMEKLFAKSVTFVWELMFTRSLFGTADMIEQHKLLNEVAALIDAGQLKSTLGENFGKISAANVVRAHEALAAGRTIGKLVLSGF